MCPLVHKRTVIGRSVRPPSGGKTHRCTRTTRGGMTLGGMALATSHLPGAFGTPVLCVVRERRPS
jgi:hypothetical protein